MDIIPNTIMIASTNILLPTMGCVINMGDNAYNPHKTLSSGHSFFENRDCTHPHHAFYWGMYN